MQIGAHESVAGGLHLALARAESDGGRALQIFTSPSLRWRPSTPSDEEASLFRSERARLDGFAPLLSHASYLVNLASPDPLLRRRSLEAMELELERCDLLGIDHVVLHPGSHRGEGVAAGLRRVGSALDVLCRASAGSRVRILLENTAGQGDTLGARFEELGTLIATSAANDRLGVCLDTCHAWAAGYDLGSADGVDETLAALERAVGLERVRAFHLNDARHPRGSRVDRHAQIGEGTIGLEGFRRLVNDSRFAGRPAVVETPPEADGRTSFARNIATLVALKRAAGATRSR